MRPGDTNFRLSSFRSVRYGWKRESRGEVRFWPGTASRPRAAGYATSAPVRAIARQLLVRFFRLHLLALRVRHLRQRVGVATARRLDCHELQRSEAATPPSKSEGNIGTGTTPEHDAVCAAKALVRGNETPIRADACNNDSVRNNAHRACVVRMSACRRFSLESLTAAIGRVPPSISCAGDRCRPLSSSES